jgi:hypothetical protein
MSEPLRVEDLEAPNEWRVAFHQHEAYIASLSSKASLFKPDTDTEHLQSAQEALGCDERLSESSVFALLCVLSLSLLKMRALARPSLPKEAVIKEVGCDSHCHRT